MNTFSHKHFFLESNHLSICLSVCLSVWRSVCISVSVCLSDCLSYCLSVSVPFRFSVRHSLSKWWRKVVSKEQRCDISADTDKLNHRIFHDSCSLFFLFICTDINSRRDAMWNWIDIENENRLFDSEVRRRGQNVTKSNEKELFALRCIEGKNSQRSRYAWEPL